MAIKPKPEQDLQNEGRLCIGSLPFVRLYRNNTGVLKDAGGIPVSFGLAIGSADTIGIVAPHGRFLSIEWKRPGWKPPRAPSPGEFQKPSRELQRHIDQCNWRDQINGMGGVAGFAQSLFDGLSLVNIAMRGLDWSHRDEESAQWATQQENEFRERMADRGKRKSTRDR